MPRPQTPEGAAGPVLSQNLKTPQALRGYQPRRPLRLRYFFGAAGAAIVSCLTILFVPQFAGSSLATCNTK